MNKNLLSLLVLISCLILAVPVMAQDEQLLSNPSFESWIVNGPGGPPDNWTYGTNRITATQTDSLPHSGTYCARVHWDSTGTLRMQQVVPVVGGATYSCSLWVADNDTSGRMRVWFFFSPSGSGGPSTYSVDHDGWQLYEYSMAAPSNATSLQVQLRFYGGNVPGAPWDTTATIYMDDVVLWGQRPAGNAPPSIGPTVRIPPGAVYPTDNVVVKSTIIDVDGTVIRDSVYYQLNAGGFTPAVHDSIVGNDYYYHLGAHPAGTAVDYYVIAIDDDNDRSQTQTFSYTVANPTPAHVPIYSLQHTLNMAWPDSCFPSDSVRLTEQITGIVVGRYEGGGATGHKRLFVQDAGTPWSGVSVYNTPDTAQVGDSVTISGVVTEYYNETEITPVASMTKYGPGTMFAPQIITCATLGMDSCSAAAEPYEGVLIQINNITLVDTLPRPDNGEFLGIDGSGDTCVVSNDMSSGGADSCVFLVGQTYGHIRGIGRYTYGRYRIMPRFSSDLYIVPSICTGGNIFDVEFASEVGTDTADCWPSPDSGQTVTVCGIVTAVRQATYPSFYLQDQNNTAWGAIYGYDYIMPNGDTIRAHVGDYVQVTSHVGEYYGWTELDNISDYIVLGTNQTLPDTMVITVSALTPMCSYVTEPYESGLVRLNNVTVRSAGTAGKYWITDVSTPDSIRIDDDLWVGGTDIPNPLPSTGATYDWIVGVARWEGRQGGANIRGWIILPRFASDYHQAVIPQPNIIDVWSVNHTTLAVSFDRAMDPVTTGIAGNYSTVHGLAINAAALDGTRRIVNLTTATQPDNAVDSLIVINVCDSMNICMTTPHQKLYHSGITPISVVQTPGPGGDSSAIVGQVVTIKGVIVADSSMTYYNNLFINDGSSPPYNGVLLFLPPPFTPFPVKGDTIIVTARVDEYFLATELTGISTYNNLIVVGHGGDPVPYHATADELDGPGLLLYEGEQLEGVLVTVCDSFTVVNDSVDAYGFIIKSLSSPADSFVVHRQPPTHTRYSYVPVEGNSIRGITGVYRYQRDKFRLMPRYDADFNSFNTWCVTGGCTYVLGDVNNSNIFNGIDVTYMVGYFKGGPPPLESCNCPPHGTFYAVGDVNGTCLFNGIDVTYAVSYFKGGPLPYPCPDCPPVGPRVAPGSGDTPAAQPVLKSRIQTQEGDSQQ
jgi:hypothetical protein